MTENKAEEKFQLPQPDQITKREKEDAMGGYLMMFAAWAVGLPFPFVNLLAAFIYFMLNRKKSDFVAFHTFQSMLSQAVISVINTVFIIWSIRILFLLDSSIETLSFEYYGAYGIFVLLWNIVYIVISLIACAQSYKGRFYYMLLFGKISFNKYYGPKAHHKKKDFQNKPPSGF